MGRGGVARQRADEVRVVPAIDAPVPAGFEIEHGGADVGVLAPGYLALAVEVPDRLGEESEDVGPGEAEGVVDVVDGGDVGFAALEGAGDAEEADEVGVVAVEELAKGGGFGTQQLSPNFSADL